ncbi:MAG: hypothetical protein AAF633_27390 [Chloroflexota bacterium]
MFRKILLPSLFIVGLGLFAIFLFPADASAQSGSCGSLYSQSDLPSLGEKSLTLNCDADEYVYIGICDVGGDRPDDLFQVRYSDGFIASQNGVDPHGRETVDINLLYLREGKNTITINSVSDSGYAPYLLAMGGSASEIGYRLLSGCGYDYVGEGFTNQFDSDTCRVDIQVFMEDAAPESGKVIVTYQYGELNRPEGIMRASTIVSAGERVDWKVNVPAPKWLRVWYQPSGSTTWYLLPSQYWQGTGTPDSEYGIWCADDDQLPSYHTSFDKRIPASDVPLFIASE